MHTLALDLDVADAVKPRYRRLPIRAKTKFHVDQMIVEFERLRLLVSQACQHIYETEVKIKYIEGLKIQRANKTHILKFVHTQQ